MNFQEGVVRKFMRKAKKKGGGGARVDSTLSPGPFKVRTLRQQ